MKRSLSYGLSVCQTFVSCLCLRGVWVCVCGWVWVKCLYENEHVTQEHWLWALRWLSLCSGFLLWQLAEWGWWVGESGLLLLMGLGRGCSDYIECHDLTPSQTLSVHSVLGRKKSASQLLCAEIKTLTRQGLDHSPCTTFRPLPFLSFFPIHPILLMGLPINSCSCNGYVHRYDVSECWCLCPKVEM